METADAGQTNSGVSTAEVTSLRQELDNLTKVGGCCGRP